MSGRNKILIISASFILAILLIRAALYPRCPDSLLREIDLLLDNYSHALAAEEIPEVTGYSPEMQRLIRDRRHFYAAYLSTGLMSELQTLDSEFYYEPQREFFIPRFINTVLAPGSTDIHRDILLGRLLALPFDAQIQVLSDDRFALRVTEVVTLHAKYDIPPKQHPSVLGAQWALERTEDLLVKQKLQEHITSVTNDTHTSHSEGYDLVLILNHHMIFERTPTGLQVIKDAFTDRDTISEGVDNVTWIDGHFVRDTTTITTTAEYLLYQSSVEEIGKKLLERYSKTW